jgi:hypothetical protein
MGMSMEFFRELQTALSPAALQQSMTIEGLAQFCAHIDRVLSSTGDEGEIYCLWGQFRVRRESIAGGVRFSLADCPNALAWTLTTGLPPDPGRLVIHCTINRREHEPDFVESIELFLDAWVEGMERLAVS